MEPARHVHDTVKLILSLSIVIVFFGPHFHSESRGCRDFATSPEHQLRVSGKYIKIENTLVITVAEFRQRMKKKRQINYGNEFFPDAFLFTNLLPTSVWKWNLRLY